ncbi:S-layer homology domain-containing protein [Aeromicrobium alkaliterrae]|uniref:SLH domain-containing protein n=1 Tax=Aeromicrobium alkaliterrae TaxID=302168 RepID=A0ABN2JXX8_9ACTN
MSRSTRLLGLGAAAAVLAPLALVAPAAVAATPADSQPSVSAGDWLAGEVVAGTGPQAGQGFLLSAYSGNNPDFGIAADAIVSFDHQEAHPEAVTALTAGLEANYEGYVNPTFPAPPEGQAQEQGTFLNAGTLAKTVLAATVTGSATDFGGENLLAQLEGTLASNGQALNQGGSQQGKGSVFNQTYAVEALAENGSASTTAAAEALVNAQCDDGGFPFAFPTGPEDCFSDVDTTARAVIALAAAQNNIGNAQGFASDATDWLGSQQQADGSFGFEFPAGTFNPSASSTLLAAQAFEAFTTSSELAPDRRATRAAGFVRTLQLDSVSGAGSLAGDVGAILSTQEDFNGATEAGSLSAFERTGATFAAAQAYGGLAVLDGTTEFSDTPTTATFFTEIAWLSSRGITTGYAEANGSTSFRGSQPVLREQMAAFLYRYDNEGTNPPAGAPNATFSDAVNNTFSKHIAWLASEGITTGYADNTFRPSAPVLREQMAAFLYRLAGSPTFTAPATSPFTDVPTTATFYKQITWLDAVGVTTGYEGPNGTRTFRGSDPVLREQMAAFLYRFYVNTLVG